MGRDLSKKSSWLERRGKERGKRRRRMRKRKRRGEEKKVKKVREIFGK